MTKGTSKLLEMPFLEKQPYLLNFSYDIIKA